MLPEEEEHLAQEKIDAIQDKIESNIKEAKHWLGSWSALRELINDLEDREKEKAYENPKY